MKYSIYLTCLLLLVIFFSCSKDDITTPQDLTLASERAALPSVLSVINLLTDPVDGYISITSHGTYASQNLRGPEIVIQGLLKDQTGAAKDFGNLTIKSENIPFTISPYGQAKYGGIPGFFANAPTFYGNTFPINVAGKTVNGITYPGLNTSFYSPALIQLTHPVYQNNPVLTPSDFVINWIPDQANSNGVGILIHYSADDPDNGGISNDLTDYIAIHTEDDGSYTFSPQDLSFIPNNGRAYLVIGRANYVKANMNDPAYAVGIYSYSTISHKFTFNR